AREPARRRHPHHPARHSQDTRGHAGPARVQHREGGGLLDVPGMSVLAFAVALLASCVFGVAAAAGAEVRVLSAGAMKAMVTELSEGFQKETGHTVAITADTGGGLKRKVEGGEKADVLIAPDAVMDALTKSNHVVAGSRTDLAKTAIGVAVRQGVALVGPLPAELNKITVYASSLLASSPTPEAGRAFLAYLARPEFRAKFAAAGLDYK